jgi:hypothetical protein
MADLGRPCKFTDIDVLQSIIDKYFDDREKEQKPLTITGLAIALDTTRETLMDIEKENWGYDKTFSDAIKKAKLRCQAYTEDQMYIARNPAGAIFGLKNYGWRDTQDINMTLDGYDVTVGMPKPEE